MKKIVFISLLGVSFAGFSKEIKIKKSPKKPITTSINCWAVYKDARDAALGQGFTIGNAQQIGMAAYYGCSRMNVKTIE